MLLPVEPADDDQVLGILDVHVQPVAGADVAGSVSDAVLLWCAAVGRWVTVEVCGPLRAGGGEGAEGREPAAAQQPEL